jgi:hypothetical protein
VFDLGPRLFGARLILMPLSANSSPALRTDRALTTLSASGPALWFATLIGAYALSPRACEAAAWLGLVTALVASLICSSLALRACARRLQGSDGMAELTPRSFVLLSGVMLNAFSVLLTIGSFAALLMGSRCD